MNPIPPAFTAKKNTILSSLSTPETSYKDLSPKGSVDTPIKSLINRMNALDGIVTTSSCSGRVSVFLEGRKGGKSEERDGGEGRVTGQIAVPGGKGRGGRWLFVSHEPVEMIDEVEEADGGFTRLLGISKSVEGPSFEGLDVHEMRFVRFQFEPMILHIMTASLHHAQSILAAAINAGFRESGVQSLKNLNDPNAFPMVAVRTSGLAFESLIGFLKESGPSEEVETGSEGIIHSLVNEDYLRMLLKIANERFQTNTERTKRFEDALLSGRSRPSPGWEDAMTRQTRMKAEGLARRQALHKGQNDEEDARMVWLDGFNDKDEGNVLGVFSGIS